MNACGRRALLLVLSITAVALAPSRALAQQPPPFQVLGANAQERANAALTLTTGDPRLTLWQVRYGMSLSDSFPLGAFEPATEAPAGAMAGREAADVVQ
jgi:hypothetical protein